MKRRPERKVRRKATKQVKVRKRSRAVRPRTARALDLALKRMKRAVSVAVSSGDAVVRSAEAIAQTAATRTKAQLLTSLLDDEVLTTLYGLPDSEGMADIESALRLHSAWLREHFELEPLYERGQVLEIPAERLAAFDVPDAKGQSPKAICALRIVASGWKQGSKVVRKPVATVHIGENTT